MTAQTMGLLPSKSPAAQGKGTQKSIKAAKHIHKSLFIISSRFLLDSFHRVALRFEAGPVSAVIRLSFLLGRTRLLLGLLLLGLLLLSSLVSLPHPTQQTAGGGTNGSPFTGITSDGADRYTHKRPPGRTFHHAPLWGLLLRRRRTRRGRLHGIESGLLFGPGVTGEFVLLHLLLTLPPFGKNDKILGTDRPYDQ
jgi:hypothetical protein